MPININLLAETQMAEDLRRRDPVKRAIFAGTFFIVLTLVWSSSLQLTIVVERNALSQTQAQIDERNGAWQDTQVSAKKISDANAKLQALQNLSAARFLQGNFMDALQKIYTDGVQLTRVRLDQSYFTTPGAANHPGTATERIVMTLDARDSSASPGVQQVSKFKDAVASQAFFAGMLNKTNGVQLTSLSPTQSGSDRPYVVFTVESTFPDKIR